MNKTKRPDLKTNENGFASRRPKRCHLCKKNFQAEKYVTIDPPRTNTSRHVTEYKTKRSKTAETKHSKNLSQIESTSHPVKHLQGPTPTKSRVLSGQIDLILQINLE